MKVGAIVVSCLVCASMARSQDVRATASRPSIARQDSAAAFREAWRLVVSGHTGRRAVSLWMPASHDTATAARISPGLNQLLKTQAVPISTQRIVADDTVVFRVLSWQRDSVGELFVFRSTWTTILGPSGRRCRTGSVNHATVRVRREMGRWLAEYAGPVFHGDDVCTPIDTSRYL